MTSPCKIIAGIQAAGDFSLPEWCYGDSGPASVSSHGIGYPWGTESRAQQIQKKFLIDLLKATGAQTHAYNAVLNLRQVRFDLQRCATGLRCYSAACALCGRALQKWLCWAAPKILRESTPTRDFGPVKFHHASFACLSIIPELRLRGGVDLKHVRHSLRQMLRLLHAALDKAGIDLLIGGIDVSLNSSEQKDYRPHFQFHLWGLAPFDQAQAAKPALIRAFPKRPGVPKPVWVSKQKYDGKIAGVAYALKSSFDQRKSSPLIRSNARPNQGSRITHDPLTIAQKLALAPILHEFRPHGRLFLHGAEIGRDSADNPTICLMPIYMKSTDTN